MDKVAVVRSVTHPYPLHGVAYALSGIPRISGPEELNPRDPSHYPFIGSVVDYADRARAEDRPATCRGTCCCPGPSAAGRVGEVPRAGPYARVPRRGLTTRSRPSSSARGRSRPARPSPGEDLGGPRALSRDHPREPVPARARRLRRSDLTFDRLDRRRTLLEQLESARREPRRRTARGSTGIGRWRYSLLASEKLRRAFDLDRESLATRESYGMTLFGQAALRPAGWSRPAAGS